MKKKVILMLVALLVLAFSFALSESKTVYLPDQHLSARKYGSELIKRQPNTVVYSLTADGYAHWGNVAGGFSVEDVGEIKAKLTEYDQSTDTYYVTNLIITVRPQDKEFDFSWDQSLNSDTFADYRTNKGWYFPVGANFSYKHTATYGDRKLDVTYRSNNPSVAVIDENGWVTMVGAGTANLEARCPEMETGQVIFVTVYSENSGGNIWSSYTPSDPAEKANVYQEPNTSSKVLFTISDSIKIADQDLLLHFIAKREGWVKITCQLGTGWVQDKYFSFSGEGIYVPPALEEGEQITGMPSEEVYSNYQVGSTVYASGAYETIIYKEPDKGGDVLMRVDLNTPMTVKGRKDSFLKVNCQGKTGYILYYEVKVEPVTVTFDRDLTFPCTMYVYTTIEDMALWQTPGRIKIDEIPRNTKVTALGVEQKGVTFYFKVEVNGKTGYMDERYLTSIKPEDRPDTGDLDVMYTTRTNGITKVYLSASTSSPEVSTLGRDHRVRVVSVSGSWAFCRVNSDEGYIRLSNLVDPSEIEEPVSGEILTVFTPNGGAVNVRKLPSLEAGRVTTLRPGTKVPVIKKENSIWYKVRVNGQTGYIMAMYLMSDTPQTPEENQPAVPSLTVMTVKTANGKSLNLRKTPSSEGTLIDRYPVGTKVTVLGDAGGGWYKVKAGSNTGYMMAVHLAAQTPSVPETPETETPGQIETPENPSTPETPETEQPQQPSTPTVTVMTVKTANGKSLNLRQTPSSEGKLIDRYPVGTKVTVLGDAGGGWYKVKVGRNTGYMMAVHLAAQTPAVPETPETPETETPGSSGTNADPGTVMVVKTSNGKSLNMREKPRTGVKVLGQFPVGTRVTVIDALDNEWNYVRVGNLCGYMMDQYLVALQTPPQENAGDQGSGGNQENQNHQNNENNQENNAENTSGVSGAKTLTVSTPNGKSLNLRQVPRSGSKILGQYPVGTKVTVLGELDDTWNYVRVGGQEGFMMDKFLK